MLAKLLGLDMPCARVFQAVPSHLAMRPTAMLPCTCENEPPTKRAPLGSTAKAVTLPFVPPPTPVTKPELTFARLRAVVLFTCVKLPPTYRSPLASTARAYTEPLLPVIHTLPHEVPSNWARPPKSVPPPAYRVPLGATASDVMVPFRPPPTLLQLVPFHFATWLAATPPVAATAVAYTLLCRPEPRELQVVPDSRATLAQPMLRVKAPAAYRPPLPSGVMACTTEVVVVLGAAPNVPVLTAAQAVPFHLATRLVEVEQTR